MTATRFESLSPILAADDLHQALAFYRDLLGFDLAWCWASLRNWPAFAATPSK